MGAARIEVYAKGDRWAKFPGLVDSGMPQVATETTSTTATTAGSRIAVAQPTSGKRSLFASVVVDEDCYLSIGADPTAAAATSFLLKANVAREFAVNVGDLFSFKDVA